MRHRRVIESPVGRLGLESDTAAVTRIHFHADPDFAASAPDADPLLDEIRRQLAAYFEGTLHTFDLPLKPEGTDFDLEVWHALLEIPYGATASYGEIARRLDKPGASRAVGLANGRNPIPIVIPCHRVIGSDGTLTGFGGGLATKRQLLDHEGAMPQLSLFT